MLLPSQMCKIKGYIKVGTGEAANATNISRVQAHVHQGMQGSSDNYHNVILTL